MKRFAVRWAEVARDDLDRIVDYIAADSVDNALRVARRIEELAAKLQAFPARGHVVPELARHGIREWVQVSSPPWRLIYRVDRRRVEIVALVDGRRNLEELLFERLMHPE